LAAQDQTPEILECIDRAFSKFGSSVSSVVYFHFEHSTKLSRRELVRRPDLFSKSLFDIFHDGSTVIEKAMVSELRTTFRLSNRNYKGLADALSELKQMRQ